jgi:hypothetical protein
MGDEFKKAIEEALKEMETEEAGNEKGETSTSRPAKKAPKKKKSPMNKLSRASKKSLK